MDIIVARALNGARWRFKPGSRRSLDYQTGVIYVHRGVAVTMTRRFPTYAVTSHRTRTHRRHRARAVFLAWRGGKVLGWKAFLLCGATLVDPHLIEAAWSTACRKCEFTYQEQQRGGETDGRMAV